MRRTTILLAGLGLALIQAPASPGGTMTQPKPDREVLDVIETWNQAFAANDPDRYFTFIDEDITVLTPSNPYRVEGIPDDREEFEWGIRTGRSRVGYFQEMQRHLQRYGDVAVVTYFSRGSYGPDGKEVVAYLKETDVLVRREDGWKIVHIHVSSNP
ncbi:MAG: YybH family protein [Gemmatimonadota bacterium]